MAPFNPFPVGYQAYNPYQQYQQFAPQVAPVQGQSANQPQTKYVEVIPVDNEQEVTNCPMSAGSTGFFFARDDSFNAVKSVSLNGQVTVAFFDKRPPAPVAPPVDLSAYVRRDEIGELVAAAVAAQSGGKKGKKADEAES